MKVTILRGLPGSGKSWLAQTMTGSPKIIVSADHYFLTPREVYKFDPAKLPLAHNQCLRLFLNSLQDYGLNDNAHLIVDNTNISAWEIAPYYRLAEAFCCEVEIFTVWTAFVTCLDWQTHGVPIATMEKMRKTLETEILPPWWKMREVPKDENASTAAVEAPWLGNHS